MLPVFVPTLITPDRSTVLYSARGHPLRSPIALCSMQRHMSTVEVRPQPPTFTLSSTSADLSRFPPPWRRTTVASGSMWPKSLILPTSRGHMDLARKIIIGNHLLLLLRLLVVSC